MPTSTRRQAQARHPPRANASRVGAIDADLSSDALPGDDNDEDGNADAVDSGEDQECEDDCEVADPELNEDPFPPPGLKEISSLASWTVSTAKPGNGVSALRSPDTNLFWQSDGPQPHLLSIHFFKLVSIVHMRIFLDFVSDESYTPTKIQFLAGMSVHDLQQFAEMSFEQPTGWIDVDFTNVGPIQDDDGDDMDEGREVDWTKRPVLRAFLVQVKILENHQNGKDTHLRAVQLFSRDETQTVRPATSSVTRSSKVPAVSEKSQPRLHPIESNNIKLASWMADPDIR